MLEELWVPLVVSLVAQLAKRLGAKSTELGDWGLYIVVFIIGLIIAGFQFAWKFLPLKYTEYAGAIFAGAMVWYELILKRIPAVKKLGGK